MTRRICLSLAAALVGFMGCATYHPEPLDHSAVAARLEMPNMASVQVQAKGIEHPILKPLDFDARDGLSPDEAAIMAVLVNPALRAVRDQRGIASAQLLQAGILPNPQLGYTMDFPTGGNTTDTVNAFGLDIGWEITTLISRGAEIDAARAEAASVDLDVAWQEWQVAEAAKLHVYRLVFLDKQLAVARSEEEGLRENLDNYRKAVDLGFMTIVDYSAAEAALQSAHSSALGIEQEWEQERLALNETLGVPPEQRIPLQQDIQPPSMETLPSITEIMNGIEQRRLDLVALKMGYQSQEARVRSAVLAQFPKINIGFSHAGDTSNVITTGIGISIDLPVFDRNQGQIAIEKATRQQLFDEYISRMYQARSDVAKILANMNSITREIKADEQAIPTLKTLVQNYHAALLAGNADVLSYYSARNQLFEKQIELYKFRQELADQINAFEIAAGWYGGRAETQGAAK